MFGPVELTYRAKVGQTTDLELCPDLAKTGTFAENNFVNNFGRRTSSYSFKNIIDGGILWFIVCLQYHVFFTS